MFLLILIAMIVVVIVGLSAAGVRGEYKKRHSPAPLTANERASEASKIIKKAYDRLPAENRPVDNIDSILKALDVKYDRGNVNRHFMDRYRERYIIKDHHGSWERCSVKHCPYPEFTQLYENIMGVVQAINEQKHALEVACVQDGLDAASDLLIRLREEQNLIKSVTRELV